MFVARNPKIREAARQLRRDGWSLREIAGHLEVSLGRTSEWVRDISQEQRRCAPDDTSPMEALPVWSSGSLGRCARCGLLLPLELFSRLRDGRQAWCKSCFRSYHGGRRDVARGRTLTRIEAAQAFIIAYLDSHPCIECGADDPVVLEFDHVRDKRHLVSSLVAHGAPLGRIALEIERCEVVCVNCHRRRTAQRQGSRRLGETFVGSGTRPLRDRNLRFLFDRLRAAGCTDCGEQDLVALDFDHVDGKTANVAHLANRECSLARLEEEISKCVVRCANCHRRKTAEDFGYYRFRLAA